MDSDAPIASVDQNKLLEEMRAEGLAMRYNSWELTKTEGPNHLMVTEKEEKPLIDRYRLGSNTSDIAERRVFSTSPIFSFFYQFFKFLVDNGYLT